MKCPYCYTDLPGRPIVCYFKGKEIKIGISTMLWFKISSLIRAVYIVFMTPSSLILESHKTEGYANWVLAIAKLKKLVGL
jgi:hypothetical protein